jgi:hypothetical protein
MVSHGFDHHEAGVFASQKTRICRGLSRQQRDAALSVEEEAPAILRGSGEARRQAGGFAKNAWDKRKTTVFPGLPGRSWRRSQVVKRTSSGVKVDGAAAITACWIVAMVALPPRETGSLPVAAGQSSKTAIEVL